MAQTVSTKFLNAQDAPANLPVARVELVLGDYANASAYGSSASASGEDASGNYPAAGAIDGDRTELNVGPASGADNFIGKSSWRSAAAPSTIPQTLDITFAQSRTINRLKLYHLSAHALSSFKFSYWDGSGFVDFASTADLGIGTIFTTTGQLDIVNFDDISTAKVRLTVYNTAVASDKANVVELEAYRVIDVTERVRGVRVSRQRDYKLANPMAATVHLDCINTDRFFSISHSPTAAEEANGFVNPELRPNIQIHVHFGFNLYDGAPETAPAIVAYLDSISPSPGGRTCKISGRDGMKPLLNRVDSSNLKTNVDIADAIRYILNRSNVSNYEMSLDSTSIVLPYFFTDQEDHLTTVRDLVQASGDATFFFNESGTAVFKFYTGQLPLAFIYPIQAAWSVGAFFGNMTVDGSNQLALNVQKTTPKTSNNSGFITASVATTPSNRSVRVVAQSFQLPYDTTLTNVTFTVHYAVPPATPTTGTFRIWSDNNGQPSSTVLFSQSVPTPVGSDVTLTVNVSPNLSLVGGIYWYGLVMTDTITIASTIGKADLNVTAPAQTAPTLPAPYPNTLAQGTNATVWTVFNCTNPPLTFPNPSPVKNLGVYTFRQATGSGTWTSAPLDTGTSTLSYTPLGIIYALNGNPASNLTVYTRSSANGISWTPYITTTSNFQPRSPVQRYLQVLISFTQSVLTGFSITVSSLQINWIGGSGDPKYPPAPSSFTFDYNSNLIAVDQELADNLGGDTSIINDVTAQASPLRLTGSNSDTVWQGTVGNPPANISGTAPLPITVGVPITIQPYISGGMDTSFMLGANPSAAALSFGGGGAATWSFTQINPTLPVLVITPTVTGTITDLRIIGKVFSNETIQQVAVTQNAQSIQLYGDRKQSVQNKWIPTAQLAQAIAANIVSVFKDPFSYIPAFTVQPTFSIQIGDRVTVHDVNLDVEADYVAVGIDHDFQIGVDSFSVQTTGKLLAVPEGF